MKLFFLVVQIVDLLLRFFQPKLKEKTEEKANEEPNEEQKNAEEAGRPKW